jgi:hypothetical protein
MVTLHIEKGKHGPPLSVILLSSVIVTCAQLWSKNITCKIPEVNTSMQCGKYCECHGLILLVLDVVTFGCHEKMPWVRDTWNNIPVRGKGR